MSGTLWSRYCKACTLVGRQKRTRSVPFCLGSQQQGLQLLLQQSLPQLFPPQIPLPLPQQQISRIMMISQMHEQLLELLNHIVSSPHLS